MNPTLYLYMSDHENDDMANRAMPQYQMQPWRGMAVINMQSSVVDVW